MKGRLVLTVALIYALHFAPNVVRETYLAVAIGDHLSIRVDPFLGLHPDLFEIPGRGAFIDSNPGASMLGAIPYAVARPAFALLFHWKPELTAPKPPATYDDPRQNRTRFMNESRARGLDVKLALAAAAIHLGINVPLGALGALAVFLFLRDRLRRERTALWLALLFAFGTPVFFRSAFLNQNLLVAYCTLFAYLALVWRRGHSSSRTRPGPERLILAGALLGLGVLCDYSAVPLLLAFGLWIKLLGIRDGGLLRGGTDAVIFTAGAAAPLVVLFAYQYAAFGSPFLPAQAYMPATDLSGSGWHGLALPQADLLWRNLVDPAYGLFVFCPMLAAAFAAPSYRRSVDGVGADELTLIFGASLALYLFSSSVSFAALQWNTGVRYMVPAATLLFFAAVPVLTHASQFVKWLLIAPTVVISWAVTMARESVPVSLAQIATGGPELPWQTVLQKTSPAYLPALAAPWVPFVVLLLTSLVLGAFWRSYCRASAKAGQPDLNGATRSAEERVP